jgi:hypothetical protein
LPRNLWLQFSERRSARIEEIQGHDFKTQGYSKVGRPAYHALLDAGLRIRGSAQFFDTHRIKHGRDATGWRHN